MKITLFGYFVCQAIQDYIFKKYGLDEDKMYIESMYIKPDKPYEDRILKWPTSFDRDQEYNPDLKEFVTTTEYDVEGIYLKRKKKGSKKYHYVELKHSDLYQPSLNEEESSIDIWIESKEDM